MGKKLSGLQNGSIKVLQIGAREITNRGSFRNFKAGKKDYKSGQRDFELGQEEFQIGTEITNWCRTELKYKHS